MHGHAGKLHLNALCEQVGVCGKPGGGFGPTDAMLSLCLAITALTSKPALLPAPLSQSKNCQQQKLASISMRFLLAPSFGLQYSDMLLDNVIRKAHLDHFRLSTCRAACV